ncbi:MAG: rhomboid family intramembrane serine protease [Planctomycetota bacterium]|jgi:membrane associated rhomboid family serine protease
MLIPIKVDVIHDEKPVTNVAIVGVILLVFVGQLLAGMDARLFRSFLLDGFSLPGLFTHMFLHANLFHLIGNMIFLWVFGNAVCAWLGNKLYPAAFLLFGLLSAVAHIVLDGRLALGASGAINGIVGLYLVLYPKNYVYLFYLIYYRAGIAEVRGIWIILYWLLFDLVGAAVQLKAVAYFAHLGGFAAGVITGLILLKLVKIEHDVEFERTKSYRPDQQPLFMQKNGKSLSRPLDSPQRPRAPEGKTSFRRPRPPDEVGS